MQRNRGVNVEPISVWSLLRWKREAQAVTFQRPRLVPALRATLLLLAFLLSAPLLRAQSLSLPFGFSSDAAPEIWLADDTAKPGQTVMAGVHLKLPKGWHTYWRDPGDSGTAPKIDWTLPKGVTADPILWPVPEKDLATAGDIKLYTYVYRDECVLLVPLHLAADLAPGPLELSAKVFWQQCAESCVQKNGATKATLTIGPEEKPSTHVADLQTWQARLPKAKLETPVSAAWVSAASESNRLFKIELTGAPKSTDFFPFHGENFAVQGETKVTEGANGAVTLTTSV